MIFRATADVAAAADAVFAVYADVERWPEWTASVSAVQRLDEGPLRVGARTRIRQPKLPVAVWEVTAWVPGRSFTWVSRAPGLLTTAVHEVSSGPDGRGCHVVATLEQGGIFGPLLAGMTKGITQRYMELELSGLKARCEG